MFYSAETPVEVDGETLMQLARARFKFHWIDETVAGHRDDPVAALGSFRRYTRGTTSFRFDVQSGRLNHVDFRWSNTNPIDWNLIESCLGARCASAAQALSGSDRYAGREFEFTPTELEQLSPAWAEFFSQSDPPVTMENADLELVRAFWERLRSDLDSLVEGQILDGFIRFESPKDQ